MYSIWIVISCNFYIPVNGHWVYTKLLQVNIYLLILFFIYKRLSELLTYSLIWFKFEPQYKRFVWFILVCIKDVFSPKLNKSVSYSSKHGMNAFILYILIYLGFNYIFTYTFLNLSLLIYLYLAESFHIYCFFLIINSANFNPYAVTLSYKIWLLLLSFPTL